MTIASYPYPVPTDLSQWAADVEATNGYPSSDTPALIAWGQAEGGSFHNIDYGNVLGTTRNTDAAGNPLGGVPTNAPGVLNFGGVGTQAQAWQAGLESLYAMLHQSNMADINSALSSGVPSELPAALQRDPWGTNGASVASILGENPDTIAAMGNAAGSSSGSSSGGNGMMLTGNGTTPNATLTSGGILGALGGTAASFFGLQPGHLLQRGLFILVGVILLIIALKEMFGDHDAITIMQSTPDHVRSMGKKAGESAATAAAVTPK